MSKKSSSTPTKTYWAFWVVVIGGLAYLAAYLFAKFGANNLARVGAWIAAVCGAIAWIIVFIFGWRRVRENNVWMVIVYIVCMLMIIVFVFLPLI